MIIIINNKLDFLSGRQTALCCVEGGGKGKLSRVQSTGSVLGPTLVLCYITDFPDLLCAKLAFIMLMTLFIIKLLTTIRMKKCFR